jgi:hypothetical protein
MDLANPAILYRFSFSRDLSTPNTCHLVRLPPCAALIVTLPHPRETAMPQSNAMGLLFLASFLFATSSLSPSLAQTSVDLASGEYGSGNASGDRYLRGRGE